MDEIIVLRSVFGKIGKYYIQPCKQPNGQYPDCVKRVNSQGDMILTDAERNSQKVFIPETETFIIEDGTSFNLSDPYDAAKWEAIKNCVYICEDRWQKNSNGDYVIDGTIDMKSRKPRYGIAELYVDRPGFDSQIKNTKRKKVLKASTYILEDPRGLDGLLTTGKVLGAHMSNMPSAEVEDYLLSIAERDPDRILAIYEGDDLQLRILFIDAKDKKIITKKNKAWWYGETLLGASDESVLTLMQTPKNKKIVDLISRDTYPENYVSEN